MFATGGRFLGCLLGTGSACGGGGSGSRRDDVHQLFHFLLVIGIFDHLEPLVVLFQQFHVFRQARHCLLAQNHLSGSFLDLLLFFFWLIFYGQQFISFFFL